MKKFSLPIVIALILLSCEPPREEPENSLSASPREFNIIAKAGYLDSFTVDASVNWTASISSGVTWLTLNTSTGSSGKTVVRFNTTETNYGNVGREAIITIKSDVSGVAPELVRINQSSVSPLLTTNLTTMYINGIQNEKDSFIIGANVNWQIAASENWLTLNPTSGSRDEKIYVTNNDDNLTDNIRTAVLTLSPVGTTLVQPKVISISQKYWYRPYGGNGYDALLCGERLDANSLVFAGATASYDNDLTMHHGLLDVWVVKTDDKGKKLWQKAFGGDLDEVAESVTFANGGYAIAGYTASNNEDVSGNHGREDIWIIKVDNNGNLVWQKAFGGTGFDRAHSIMQTADGGFIVTGSTDSNDGDFAGSGNKNLFVLKLDGLGNKQWLKTFGGSNGEDGFGLEQLPSGYYVCGGTSSFDGDITGHPGSGYHAWVLRLDASGTLLWQRVISDQLGTVAKSIYNTDDGGVIVAGTITKTTMTSDGLQNDKDFWISRLAANGAVSWQKAFGGSNLDEVKTLYRSGQNDYVCAGSTWSNNGDISGYTARQDIWILKFDPNGNKLAQKTLGGDRDEYCTSIFSLPGQSGTLILGASTNSGKYNMSGTDIRDDGVILKVKM